MGSLEVQRNYAPWAAYKNADLTEDALAIVRKIEAQKIVDSCTLLVYEEMKVCKEIEAGKAGFGYTTIGQEISARGEYRKRFEFNCLQLADFKKKYL